MRLGLLYPGHAAEDDLPWLVDALLPDRSVSADVVHTSVGEDAHRIDALLDLGSADRLREGAAALARNGADVAVWACTSGSFVFGLHGARRQVAELEADFGGPASSTSLAFVEALHALKLRRVAVAATYPEPVTSCFVDLLGHAGIEVVGSGSQGIITAEEVGTVGREAVLALVAAGDHRDAEAVLVPDTALHTVRWLDDLESAVGKPVVTANQVTIWEALRLARRPVRATGHGRLFTAELPDGPGAVAETGTADPPGPEGGPRE
jgi:maleate cis-trans isomerase